MEKDIKIYSLAYTEFRTYLFSTLFVLGNLLLPQLCHLLPDGGQVWQPLFLFTLIGAYKYGWRVGLLTAVVSPIANHLLFGMPQAGMLALILVKSVVLAIVASGVAHQLKTVKWTALLLVVMAYQLVGALVDAAVFSGMSAAVAHFVKALPGMAVQILGGYYIIKHIGD